MQKAIFSSLMCFALFGCAANSSVAPIGPDTFMVSRQAATGFSGAGTLKAEALTEAGQFCMTRNKVLYVTNTIEAAPPYTMGNFPRAEINFMCLDANDPRLKGTPQISTQQYRRL